MAEDRRFPYRLEPRFRWAWTLARAKPETDAVVLTGDGRFVATFGRFRVDTPLANVDGAHTTGPYRWWKAIGVRASRKDDGLTFGTSAAGGTCVHFTDPVRGVLPMRKHHSALTVTVEDPAALAAALARPSPAADAT